MEFGGQMNWTPSHLCVGNAFMRSETMDDLRNLLNGNSPIYIFDIFPFNLLVLKQQPSECMNAFPTKILSCYPFNAPTQNCTKYEKILLELQKEFAKEESQ